MQTVLIIVHLIIVLALIGVVLLQRSEGGGMGLGGGGGGGVSGFMTGRGQANALTRATAILAGLFFVTSLALDDHGELRRGRRARSSTAPLRRRAGPAGSGRRRRAATFSSSCSACRASSRGPAPGIRPALRAPAAPQVPQSQ